MNTAANALAHYTAQLKRPTHPPLLAKWLESLPAESLRSEAIALAQELAQLKGYGHEAQDGSEMIRLSLGDGECMVEFEYEPKSPDGPAEVNILGVLINGLWLDPDGAIDDGTLVRWEREIFQHIEDRNERDRADMADAQEAA